MSTTRNNLIIGICDNEIFDLKWIQETLEELINKQHLSQHWEIHTYTSGEALLEFIQINAITLLFLDIEMPECSGFELANKIHMLHPDTHIAFVSNHEGFVYDSFDYAPLRFVRKKSLSEDLEKALQKYIWLTANKRIHYKFSDKCCSRDIPLNDIRYFECNSHNIAVITKEQIYHTYGTLKLVEKDLEHDGFIRIHRNYLLNIKYIGHIRSRDIELLDGSKLPLSRDRKKTIRDALNKYERML